MAELQWRSDYSVGVESVDWEHRQLFDMMNELEGAIESRKGQEIGYFLTGLLIYTREHFVNEENLMLQINYPDYLAHKAEHEKLTNRAMELIESDSTAESTLTLLQFLKDWLRLHILGWDMKYKKYMRAAHLN
jgi:hemerythrin